MSMSGQGIECKNLLSAIKKLEEHLSLNIESFHVGIISPDVMVGIVSNSKNLNAITALFKDFQSKAELFKKSGPTPDEIKLIIPEANSLRQNANVFYRKLKTNSDGEKFAKKLEQDLAEEV